MNVIDAAQEYRNMGWHVIPMRPGEKQPAVKWRDMADQDPGLSCFPPPLPRARYLVDNPGAGLGVLLRPSRLLCIDCDSLRAIQEVVELTPERCNNVVISAHGAHLYYRRPADCPPLRAIQRGECQKIDIMADGYMILPPSVHPSGHRYTWQSQGPLQDAPAWAVGLLMAIRERSIAHTQIDPQSVTGAFPNTPEEVQLLLAAINELNPRVAGLLAGPRSAYANVKLDRSRELWVTINTLCRLLNEHTLAVDMYPKAQRLRLKNTIGRLSDESIAKVVWFGTLGCDLVGDKPRERGWQWLCDEIARARMETLPGAV